jgi:membrane protease YdiL (CAAX protease family)
LDFESLRDPSSTKPDQGPRGGEVLNKIFLNNEGLRSGWRLLLYLAFWFMIDFAAHFLAVQFSGSAPGNRLSPQSVFLEELLGFAAAFGTALLMAQIEGRTPGVYGLPPKGAFGRLFWVGVLLGSAEVTLLIGSIAAFGGYGFGKLAMQGGDILRWGAFWFAAFILVGLAEEFLFRGYTQYTLAQGVGFWPAAAFLSVLFGAVHLGNPGEGIPGAASVAATGLLFAFTLRRTGNLWLAVGWHASFDFGETFLFSVPDSGVVYDRHLSSASLHGADWLTGGSAGPEGSAFSFLIMGILAVAIHFLYPAKKTLSSSSPASQI